MLLGSHDGGSLDPDHLPDVVKQVLNEIVDGWPNKLKVRDGRGWGEELRKQFVKRPPPLKRRALRTLFRRVAHGTRGRSRRLQTAPVDTMSALPVLSRRTAVLQALGVPTLLHPGSVLDRRRIPRDGLVHVYVDVSGSVAAILDELYGAVVDCRALVHPTVHLFSTVVHDLSLEALRRGECSSTGGTSIECVVQHMKKHDIKRAVLLTDGYVGPIEGESRRILGAATLGVALTHSQRASVADLLAVADHVIEVPM